MDLDCNMNVVPQLPLANSSRVTHLDYKDIDDVNVFNILTNHSWIQSLRFRANAVVFYSI